MSAMSSSSSSRSRLSPSLPDEDLLLEDRRAEVNRKLESAARAAIRLGEKREAEMRNVETELADALSNSRVVHNDLSEALDNIQSNRSRVDRTFVHHIPRIHHELVLSRDSLSTLEARLPELRTQVRAVRTAYDTGRTKAEILVSELEWKHTPAQDKLLRIVFTSSAPVSARFAVLLRLLVALFIILVAGQLASALDGAYRAYRTRLVWGDKLIS